MSQNIWIALFSRFVNGVIRKTFVNGAPIFGVPDFVDFITFTIVSTFFTFSGHATFTLNKKWSGTIFT
jgi:hypothetical protein